MLRTRRATGRSLGVVERFGSALGDALFSARSVPIPDVVPMMVSLSLVAVIYWLAPHGS